MESRNEGKKSIEKYVEQENMRKRVEGVEEK